MVQKISQPSLVIIQEKAMPKAKKNRANPNSRFTFPPHFPFYLIDYVV